MHNPHQTPQRSQALTLIRILNGLLYGLIFLHGFLVPLVFSLFGPEDYQFFDLTPLIWSTVLIMIMAIVGVVLMRRSLRSITNKMAAELCTMVALGVAPFSACFYLGFKLYISFRETDFLSGLVIVSWTNALIYVFGFYLPFVLLALWVRYRYRPDEF